MDAYRVTLDARVLSALEKYAEFTDSTVEEIVNNACIDFLTTTATATIEARVKPQLAAAS